MTDYQLIRSARKTLAIQIGDAAQLIVRAPHRLPIVEIEAFIRSRRDWIEKKRALRTEADVNLPGFSEGELFLYLGHYYSLNFKSLNKNIEFNDAFFIDIQHKDQARAVLFQWYRKRATEILTERVALYAEHFSIRKIRIRDVSSYWGICNHQNDISFNWRIIFAPIAVVDYLIIHEGVHTKIKNHSKRFWQQVEKLCPDYRSHEAWLSSHVQWIRL